MRVRDEAVAHTADEDQEQQCEDDAPGERDVVAGSVPQEESRQRGVSATRRTHRRIGHFSVWSERDLHAERFESTPLGAAPAHVD